MNNTKLLILPAILTTISTFSANETALNLELIEAAKIGNTQKVQNLIKKGANINSADSQNQYSSLHHATNNGYIEVVKILLNNKADVNLKAQDSITPLHLAAKNGHNNIAQILIEKKPDINAKTLYDFLTPLHMAADNGNKELIESLVKAKADIKAKSYYQTSPIYYAASKNHKEAVEILALAGANIEEIKSFSLMYKTAKKLTQKNDGFNALAGKLPKEVLEIIEFLKEPERFSKVGAQMPRGILLEGPPGTGKTSIARAISHEADAEFFYISGPSIIGHYVGDGPAAVRKLFEEAKKSIQDGQSAKALIFIDEIDAIGSQRSTQSDAATMEYRNIINELLTQMDGFDKTDSIVVIGATNFAKSLDTALKRPGRFDRIVKIDLPDQESRSEILKLYSKKIKHNNQIDFRKLATLTKDWSGADLKNLVNEAAIRAARDRADAVTHEHFEIALNDIIKSRTQNN